MATSNLPPRPEPLPCRCGADGQVRWAQPDKRRPGSSGRWMRSRTCAACHYERYGEAKRAAQRKDTPHARKLQAAIDRKAAQDQEPPALALFRERISGRG